MGVEEGQAQGCTGGLKTQRLREAGGKAEGPHKHPSPPRLPAALGPVTGQGWDSSAERALGLCSLKPQAPQPGWRPGILRTPPSSRAHGGGPGDQARPAFQLWLLEPGTLRALHRCSVPQGSAAPACLHRTALGQRGDHEVQPSSLHVAPQDHPAPGPPWPGPAQHRLLPKEPTVLAGASVTAAHLGPGRGGPGRGGLCLIVFRHQLRRSESQTAERGPCSPWSRAKPGASSQERFILEPPTPLPVPSATLCQAPGFPPAE